MNQLNPRKPTSAANMPAEFKLSPVEGFDRGPSVFRFDPSGIINIDGLYHVYYTRFAPASTWRDLFEQPNLTQIWLATSADGWHWHEVGQVLPDSSNESWHQVGKHAPHVIDVNGTFYLFYTAHIGPDYHNKRIGLAVADNPAGPFRPSDSGPLLAAPQDSTTFDAVGQDDSCVLQRESEFWWYFKGYGIDAETGQPINNRICLAIADTPEGPYRRYKDNPVTFAHTACLWPHGDGVAMISDVAHAKEDLIYPACVQYSTDGVHFDKETAIQASTTDPAIQEAMALSLKHWGTHIVDAGVYCPMISGIDAPGNSVSWGLCQLPDGIYAPEPEAPHWTPFILRFDCDLN